MNCSQLHTRAIQAARNLEDYEKKPEKIEPLKYTELYATAIRYRVEYTMCCQPNGYLLPESRK